jgi:hypothetical protein
VLRALVAAAALSPLVGACGSSDAGDAPAAAFEPCGGLTAEVASEVVGRPVEMTSVPEVAGAGTCLLRDDDSSVLVQVIGSSRPEEVPLPLADPNMGESEPIEVPGADEAVVSHSEEDGLWVTSVHARTDRAVHSVIGIVEGADRDDHARIGVALLDAVLDTS